MSLVRSLRRGLAPVMASGTTMALVILVVVLGTPAASAAESTVELGTATPFAVLAGTTVTNTGPSVVSGSLGVTPGSEVTGFPPGQVVNGTEHVADAVALSAQNDLTTGYDDAAGRTPATSVSGELGGQTLAGGIYKSASALSLTGTVTLDAKGDPDAVFIFQAASTLITASTSSVALVNGAQACNVFWQVGSSATLGSGTTFVGSIMALTSATLETGATLQGRVLARNGAVNLDNNTITQATCSTPPTTEPSATGPTPTPTPTPAPAATGGSGGAVVIPEGHPETGMGGLMQSGGSALLPLGGLALLGGAVALTEAARRSRPRLVRAGLGSNDLDEDE